ncbi:ATP/GTP-binding protein [Arthrobacter monumenti]
MSVLTPPETKSELNNKKSKRKARRVEAKAAATAAARHRPPEEPPARWHGGKRSGWADKVGFYEPAAVGTDSTTRQCEATNLAVAASPTSYKGLLFGIDASSGWMIAHDPFTAYENGWIESPNVCFIGDLGKGKSSGMKTWGVLRALVLGRRVVVLDKKAQGQPPVGEYTKLAKALGVEPIRLSQDGSGSRINILDPRIASRNTESGGSAETSKTPAGQLQLLRAVLAEALGRNVSPKEGKALRVAHHSALEHARGEDREPVIGDIKDFLFTPRPEAAELAKVPLEALREWGYDPACELERMIDDDLAGIIDAPTSDDIQLTGGLTVFDLSALPEEGPAISIVMMVINTWLANTLYRQSEGVPTHLLVEEAWHLVKGTVAEVTQRNTKLSRGTGLASMFAFHHPSDIPAGSPAISMIKECDTVFLYGQKKTDNAIETERLLNLPPDTHKVLSKLTPGVCVLKIGSRDPIMVTHMRSSVEVALTDTNEAMNSRATIGLVG